MKFLIFCLAVLLLLLQIKLWTGAGGFAEVEKLEYSVAQQEALNDKYRQRNDALIAEVDDLKNGLTAVEERARTELGMIKEGETFYQVMQTAPLDDK